MWCLHQCTHIFYLEYFRSLTPTMFISSSHFMFIPPFVIERVRYPAIRHSSIATIFTWTRPTDSFIPISTTKNTARSPTRFPVSNSLCHRSSSNPRFINLDVTALHTSLKNADDDCVKGRFYLLRTKNILSDRRRRDAPLRRTPTSYCCFDRSRSTPYSFSLSTTQRVGTDLWNVDAISHIGHFIQLSRDPQNVISRNKNFGAAWIIILCACLFGMKIEKSHLILFLM